jgi:CBS-domain-containing membrane protein
MKDILIKEIMVTKVVSMRLHDTLRLVDETLRMHRIRHLPVIDERNKLIGIVTHGDILPYLSPRITDGEYIFDHEQLNTFSLERVMTKNVATLHSTDPIIKAIGIMVSKKCGCVPIVDEQHQLVGIVTQIDLLQFLHRTLSLGQDKK